MRVADARGGTHTRNLASSVALPITKGNIEAYTTSLQNSCCGFPMLQEIGGVLKAVGQYPTKDEEAALVKKHVKDGKMVNAKEFLSMVKVRTLSAPPFFPYRARPSSNFTTDLPNGYGVTLHGGLE
jgi:hypothetical protein